MPNNLPPAEAAANNAVAAGGRPQRQNDIIYPIENRKYYEAGDSNTLGTFSNSVADDLPIETDLQSCNFTNFDDELIQDILGRMILHWNYRNLKEIPPEVLENGEHIEEIYLKRNCLEKLPSNIHKLCNLTNLYLVGNQLEELPLEIGSLSCLRVLDLSQNYVKKLPSSLGDLGKLESLLLTYNQLEELPQCLKKLKRLKQLELSGNRIYSLPQEIIQGLESLEELGVDRNPISSLPRNLCLLKKLYYFSACRCNLVNLPSLPFHLLVQRGKGGSSGVPYPVQFLFDGNPRLNYMPYWVLQFLGKNVECFGCGLETGEGENSASSMQLQLYSQFTDDNRPKLKVNFKGKCRILYFDQDFVKLHHRKAGVPSLMELCLRKIHHCSILEDIISVINFGKTYQRKLSVNEPTIVAQKAVQTTPRNTGLYIVEHVTTQIPSTSRPCKISGAGNGKATAAEVLEWLLPKQLGEMLTRGPVAKCFECMTPIFTETWPIIFSIPGRILEENMGRRGGLIDERRDGVPQIAGNAGENEREENDENVVDRMELEEENNNQRIQLGCVHFCSDSCAGRFRRGENHSATGSMPQCNLQFADLKFIVENEKEWEMSSPNIK